jgi:Cof subfamily protein (haloacid dehalogenase superfamily)
MHKIYFFDIDNTLLDHTTNAIPPSALSAIDGLKRAGHTVVLATGRSYGHAKPFIDLIGPSYAITQNGSRIVKDGEEVMTIALNKDALMDLFNWMDAQGHPYGLDDGSIALISSDDPRILEPLHAVDKPLKTSTGFYVGQSVYQAWLFFEEKLDEHLFPAILKRYADFDLVRWHPIAIDILPKGINKWTACQWVMQQTGFQPHQAVAFGDGLNDLEMLQGVGFGVAMENCHPSLMAVAQRVAPALHLDGIATVLSELMPAASSHPVADARP